MNWLKLAVHWLLVLLAVTWFGGHISRVILVEPALRTLPESAQDQFNRYVERYATRIFVPVIIGVGVTGILRGTVFGPIKSVDTLLGTPYGLTFLAASSLVLYAADTAIGHRSRRDAVLGGRRLGLGTLDARFTRV